MVRVFLKEAVTIKPSRTVVKVFRNGQPAFEISPKTTTQPAATVDFLCENMQACGDRPAGTYAFQAYINGAGGEVR